MKALYYTCMLATSLAVAGSLMAIGRSEVVERRAESTAEPTAERPAVGRVDSIFTMPEMIVRFQTTVGDPVRSLAGTATSRTELLVQLTQAVVANDTAALNALRIDVAEFAYLYFPTSQWSRRPYEQPPAVQWMLTDQASRKGAAQLLKHFGGKSIASASYVCAASDKATLEGANRVWSRCDLVLNSRAANPVTLKHFGSIIERGGKYRFVSLANGL